MSKPTVPEGYVARFEHRRWVVVESIVTLDGTDYPVWSQPTLMNRHQWSRIREWDAPLTKTHILPNGGETHCRLYLKGENMLGMEDQTDELAVHAITTCTLEDGYNKSIGRNITLGAAVKSLGRSQAMLSAVEVEETAA